MQEVPNPKQQNTLNTILIILCQYEHSKISFQLGFLFKSGFWLYFFMYIINYTPYTLIYNYNIIACTFVRKD